MLYPTISFEIKRLSPICIKTFYVFARAIEVLALQHLNPALVQPLFACVLGTSYQAEGESTKEGGVPRGVTMKQRGSVGL